MQERVNAPLAKVERLIGDLADRLHQLVAVHRPLRQQPEEQQFRDAVYEIVVVP